MLQVEADVFQAYFLQLLRLLHVSRISSAALASSGRSMRHNSGRHCFNYRMDMHLDTPHPGVEVVPSRSSSFSRLEKVNNLLYFCSCVIELIQPAFAVTSFRKEFARAAIKTYDEWASDMFIGIGPTVTCFYGFICYLRIIWLVRQVKAQPLQF